MNWNTSNNASPCWIIGSSATGQLARVGAHGVRRPLSLTCGYKAFLPCQCFQESVLLLETGLITPQGRDTFCRRVIFPLGQPGLVNLYGHSIGAAFPHRLLPRPKGGLFAWDSVRYCS